MLNRHTHNADGTLNGRAQCRGVEIDPAAAAASAKGVIDAQPRQSVPRLLVSKREAARMCGIGLSTWNRYYSAGWVPQPVKLGTALRWRVADLLAWIDAGCPREQS